MPPVAFFKALADDTRLRCLLLLTQEPELCVCELTTALSLSQPKISRHLALLKQQGLIIDRRQGQWVFYRLHPELPDWGVNVLMETAKAQQNYLQANVELLQQMGERPERIQGCC